MDNLFSKPHKLIGKIQNYKWGTKNDEAYIPNLLGIVPEQDVPYAEYWIGVHPKAPSEVIIGDEKITLTDLLQKYPNEILGERVVSKFGSTLPFLLKILSINQALSIQAHPDKILAKELHKKDPINYPDENHKPEIAVAIDHLKAIVGLKKLTEIKNIFNENPELKQLISDKLRDNLNNKSISEEILIKDLYAQIMNSDKAKLENCIIALKNKFETKIALEENEKQFLTQFEFYGADVGLISLLLFNLVELKGGEAIFTPAGIPHAYLKGNIVECMANSDNVVRAGLTPKFKDIETLTAMLEVDSSKANVEIEVKTNETIYKTAADEFEIRKLNLLTEYKVMSNTEVRVLLILDGKIEIIFGESVLSFNRGETILIPAALSNFIIVEASPSVVYSVSVPN